LSYRPNREPINLSAFGVCNPLPRGRNLGQLFAVSSRLTKGRARYRA